MAYIPPKLIEIVSINFLLLFSYLLFLAGAAVLLTVAGFYFYSRTFKKQYKTWVWFGIGLIVLGILAGFFKIPLPDLVTVKIANPELIKEFSYIGRSEVFGPKDIKINPYNKKHPLNNEEMKDETMVLFWNGSITTPFFNYHSGDYTFIFQAKGSRAKEVFSKIKVEFEVPDKNHYLITHKLRYIELSPRLKEYSVPFTLAAGTIGRFRITFFNDIYLPKVRKGRDVWIKSVKVLAQ